MKPVDVLREAGIDLHPIYCPHCGRHVPVYLVYEVGGDEAETEPSCIRCALVEAGL